MVKFKKAFNEKMVLLTVSILFLLTGTIYPCPASKGSLRIPIDQKKASDRMKASEELLKRREWVEIEEWPTKIKTWTPEDEAKDEDNNIPPSFQVLISDTGKCHRQLGSGL